MPWREDRLNLTKVWVWLCGEIVCDAKIGGRSCAFTLGDMFAMRNVIYHAFCGGEQQAGSGYIALLFCSTLLSRSS